MKKQCENCNWFDPTKDDEGLCRKNPPVIVFPVEGMGHLLGFWPRVNISDWCSEHQIKHLSSRYAERPPK